MLKELEAEHFFALNWQSSISAISQTLPPLSSVTYSAMYIHPSTSDLCVVCALQRVFLDSPLLSRGDVFYYKLQWWARTALSQRAAQA